MIVTPLAKMNDRDLRDIVDSMERRAEGPPEDTRGWDRGQLVAYIESLRPNRPRRLKQRRPRRARMPKNLGVGRHARELLSRVVGQTEDRLPIGLSYFKIVQMVQKKFPDSAFDELHARWYATKMRADGHMIPVHRERSRWI